MSPVWKRVVWSAVWLTACSTETPGREVSVRLVVDAEPKSAGGRVAEFDSAAGYHVSLTEARVVLGPIYGYAPAPLAVRIADWLVPTAHAHGGHDPLGGRRVVVEFLEQLAFDALGGPRDLGSVTATAGPVGELVVALEPPNDEHRSVMHARHVYVAGVATRGAERFEFEGGVDIPDQLVLRRVAGIPLDGELEEGGTLTLHVHPHRWLDDAHFDALTERNGAGAFVITDGSQVATSLYLGVRSATALSASWSNEGGTE